MASRLQPKVFLAGRVAVESDGVVIDEGGFPGRQGRLLFAYLVAEQGRPVPREELAEALWGESPPASWDKALTGIVSKLRSLLADQGGDGGTTLTGAFGCYRLELPAGAWVDVVAAADAAQEAETALAAGDFERASNAAAGVASLLRQPFLPGEDGTWVEEKRRELADVRERALDVLADASLRSGDTREAVRWAEQAIVIAPFRESGYRRLMEAHVAAGNRAEALRVYERCRQLLAEELGAYPSPETESVYRRLLETPSPAPAEVTEAVTDVRHTASVESGADVTSAPIASARAPRWRLLVGAAIAIATAAVAAAILLTRGGHGTPAAISADAVGIFNGSGSPGGEIPVGKSPSALTVGSGSIWVTNADGDTVSRIDAATQAVVQTIPVGSSPSGITTGAGAVWVANSADATVSRIDPGTNREVDKIDVGTQPLGIVYADGAVWVANTGDATITKIDPASDKPAGTLPIAATELAFGADTLWASERAAGRVVRIDPASGKQVGGAIQVGNGPTGIAFGGGAAWVVNSLDGTASRIDPDTNQVRGLVITGNGPVAVAADSHDVWVSNQFDGKLARIDPRTRQVVQRPNVGNRPQGVAIFGDKVLVTVRQSGAGHRGGVLRVRTPDLVDSIDPAVGYGPSWLILRMTNDGLVAYNHTSGVAGTQLVPNLAVALPTPTDGGRTYAFRLRSNIRYSNGRLVKASDVRASLERYFKIGKQPVAYYDGIVGATRCKRHPKQCDLSRGIVANDTARAVTFHLVAPDAEFLYKLALDFAYLLPAGTPAKESRTRGLPATGPYMIARYRPGHTLELVRNPFFREWSKAAQPSGYPDEILFSIGGSTAAAAKAVIHGRDDVFSSSLSATQPLAEEVLDTLRLGYASQVHSNPTPHTTALFLNTRIPPFNRLEARRALNWAADRAAAVGLVGGPNAAQTTCQILPSGFPGYRPYCPYGTAPNLAKAQALVDRSGTRGMKVTYWSNPFFESFTPYAVELLRSVGYRVSTKTVAGGSYYRVVGDSRTRAQIGITDWISDYPAASAFVDPLLSCAAFLPGGTDNLNDAEFCDTRLDRRIGKALTAQVTDPYAARGLWERVDRKIVDQAPWVPLLNATTVDMLSKRVGDYQYSPNGLGMLLDQLWVL